MKTRQNLSHSFPIIESPIDGLVIRDFNSCWIISATAAICVCPNKYLGTSAILNAIWRVTSASFGKGVFSLFSQHVHCSDGKLGERGADIKVQTLTG